MTSSGSHDGAVSTGGPSTAAELTLLAHELRRHLRIVAPGTSSTPRRSRPGDLGALPTRPISSATEINERGQIRHPDWTTERGLAFVRDDGIWEAEACGHTPVRVVRAQRFVAVEGLG
jgi:hypothetical protein